MIAERKRPGRTSVWRGEFTCTECECEFNAGIRLWRGETRPKIIKQGKPIQCPACGEMACYENPEDELMSHA